MLKNFLYVILSLVVLTAVISSSTIEESNESNSFCFGGGDNSSEINVAKLIVSKEKYDNEEETKLLRKEMKELKETVAEMKKVNSLVDTPMYDPQVVYHLDIYKAMDDGIVRKVGNPNWNDTSYKSKLHHGQKLLGFGKRIENKGNGLRVDVPTGYDILWIMCDVNEFENGYAIYPESEVNTQDQYLKMIISKNWRNEVSPDGSLTDHGYKLNKWFPFSLYKPGPHIISSYSLSHPHDAWIAGLAFGRNKYWDSAYTTALTLAEALNGGDKIGKVYWRNEYVAFVNTIHSNKVFIPVIENGKDKLLFIVLHNNNWDEGITRILVNDVLIQRPSTNYFNSYSRHHNSRPDGQYVASKVPASLIPKGAKFIKVLLDHSGFTLTHFNIRKIGTHNFFPNLN